MPSCGGSGNEFLGDAGGGDDGGGGDDAAGDDGGGGGDAGEGGACQATCAGGTKTLSFPFAQYPQLKNVGGSAMNDAPGYADPNCGLSTIVVVQTAAGQYAAFSASCTHQCCTVSWRAALSEFVCPCHGSSFGLSGQVTGGPARRPLTKLQVCADDCGVTVTYG